MLQEIAQRCDMSLEGVPAVGDSLRDLQAAIAVGAKPVLVKTGKGMRTLDAISKMSDQPELAHIPVYDNLSHYVDSLLEQ
jgi:D-glycero-D-manno-heptose 1,7-bisphosphate phosphatase